MHVHPTFVVLSFPIPRPLIINEISLVDPPYAEIPLDLNDTQLGHYLIATWPKIWQAMGPEFEPYPPSSDAFAARDYRC